MYLKIAMLLVERYIRNVMTKKKPIEYPFKLGKFLTKQKKKQKKKEDGLEYLRKPYDSNT